MIQVGIVTLLNPQFIGAKQVSCARFEPREEEPFEDGEVVLGGVNEDRMLTNFTWVSRAYRNSVKTDRL